MPTTETGPCNGNYSMPLTVTDDRTVIRCRLSIHTPHDSNRLISACVLDVYSVRLEEDGNVIVFAVQMAETFESDPEFCPRDLVLVLGYIITYTVEPRVYRAGLWFWRLLLAVYEESIFGVLLAVSGKKLLEMKIC